MADDGEGNEYRWETGYEKTWEAIEEDAQGLLDTAIAEIIEKNRRRRLEERRAAGNVRLGIMRHLYIIMDLSGSMMDQDLKPNRIMSSQKILEKFVDEFFDGNPMSQMGWIGTRNKSAEKIADMSGNLRKHLEVVRTLDKIPCGGEPSFQNALDIALSSLRHMPNHTSREIVLIHGSLTTCDPRDINETIMELKKNGIRASVISLSAEVRACKSLCKETGGSFGVILDESHFQDLVREHVEPPPVVSKTESSLIKMGFPQRNQTDDPAMCLCHLEDTTASGKFAPGGYICPQCKSKYCELPVECKACSLTLVSAPHLARSFLHIFPLDPFQEVPAESCICFGCNKSLPDKNKHIYKCNQCSRRFCLDCDLFLHETLHSCPGCSSIPLATAQKR